MRGAGVVQDGFTFTEAEIARGHPRFWWGPARREAYRKVLERRGIAPKRLRDDDDDDEHAAGSDGAPHHEEGIAAAAVVTVAMAETFAEKRPEAGGQAVFGSRFDGSPDGGGDFGGGESGPDGGGGGPDGGSSE